MTKRTSIVNSTKLNAVELGSVFQIGDSVQITPRSMALAVQRQTQLFFGSEGDFNDFPIFSKEEEIPTFSENVTIRRYNKNPVIKVNNIRIISVAAAGVYHIGSTHKIDAKTRVKHIRQLLEDPDIS